jgi:glycerol-3-phosphate dehydrogenase
MFVLALSLEKRGCESDMYDMLIISGGINGVGLPAIPLAVAGSEFAKSTDDILWHRSKLGLWMNESDRMAMVATPMLQRAA